MINMWKQEIIKDQTQKRLNSMQYWTLLYADFEVTLRYVRRLAAIFYFQYWYVVKQYVGGIISGLVFNVDHSVKS